MNAFRFGLLTAAVVALAGFAHAEPPDAWAHNCASCHGKDGVGHTKAGKLVGVKDLTDAAYQKTFTDDAAFRDIKQGLKDKDGNDKMKPFAEKLSDGDITALVAYIRTLAK